MSKVEIYLGKKYREQIYQVPLEILREHLRVHKEGNLAGRVEPNLTNPWGPNMYLNSLDLAKAVRVMRVVNQLPEFCAKVIQTKQDPKK